MCNQRCGVLWFRFYYYSITVLDNVFVSFLLEELIYGYPLKIMRSEGLFIVVHFLVLVFLFF